jgi:hypothetical protein
VNPRDSGGERAGFGTHSEASSGSHVAGWLTGSRYYRSRIKKLCGEEEMQEGVGSKSHARKSTKRVDRQNDAGFNRHQHEQPDRIGVRAPIRGQVQTARTYEFQSLRVTSKNAPLSRVNQ